MAASENRLIAKGAEADISLTEYLGRPAVRKNRTSKGYRNSVLDSSIRKSRTRQEAVLLHRAKAAGVETPAVYSIEKKNTSIIMEKAEGKLLRETISRTNYKKACAAIGRNIARLHEAGIVHGDLTTSNLISADGKIVFIDFGLGFLSRKEEDFAVDLLNLRKTYLATHFSVSEGWNVIKENYCRGFSGGAGVFAKLAEVERRARYL
jgi:Kae1-associated kinase Bud32